jgi:hypothetical protein
MHLTDRTRPRQLLAVKRDVLESCHRVPRRAAPSRWMLASPEGNAVIPGGHSRLVPVALLKTYRSPACGSGGQTPPEPAGQPVIDDGRHFRSGRQLAAWIGLVPRQYTTGGTPKLGVIGKQANHYLRRQMIHGARSVAFRASGRGDIRSRWLRALAARLGFNRAIVALANKTARIAWALLTRQEVYRTA